MDIIAYKCRPIYFLPMNLHTICTNTLISENLVLKGSRVVQAFSDVEKPFLFSDLAVKAAKSENKKRLFNARDGSN